MDNKYTFPARDPITTYGVAIQLKKPTDERLHCVMFSVSGRRPLTEQEIFDRAFKLIPELWNTEKAGPFSEWTWTRYSISSMITTVGD